MFTPEERLIFAYEVRGVKKWADPLAISRNLVRASGGEFDRIDRESRDRPPDAECEGPEDFGTVLAREDAREKLHLVACAAFALPPFDPATGGGVTEAESTAVLDSFLVWLEKNGSAGGAGPATSPATATPLAATDSTT